MQRSFQKSVTGKWLADVIKKAILEGKVNCEQSNKGEVALEVNTHLGKVRVVLRRIGSKSYKVVTTYLLK